MHRFMFGRGTAATMLALALLAGCTEGAGEQSADGGQATNEMATTAAKNPGFETGSVAVDSLIDEREVHFANLRQLTFGGQNAEAYFANDDQRLIFQATPRDGTCDQEYTMRTDGTDLRMDGSSLR